MNSTPILAVLTPAKLIIFLLIVNVITFAAYGLDKRAARHQQARIPEKTLHVLGLIGGSPAAYAAQRYFRHKTRKDDFQTTFWLIVVVQVLGVGYVTYRYFTN